MTYHIKNSRGTILTTIEDRAVDLTSTSLVLHGRGTSPYGTRRNENLVHLLENFSAGSPPSNPIDGQLWWDTTDLRVWDSTFGSPAGSWELVIPVTTGAGFQVGAGAGLTDGGFPLGSPLSVTLNIGAGTGINFGSPIGSPIGGSPSLITTVDSEIRHDNLFGFVEDEHIDHSTVVLTAGRGLTGGGIIAPGGSPVTLIIFNVVGGSPPLVGAGGSPITGSPLSGSPPGDGESYLPLLNLAMTSGNQSFATMQITYDQNDSTADLVTKPSETAGPHFHYPLMPRWTNQGSPSSVSTIGGKHYYEIEIRDIETPSSHESGPYLGFGQLENLRHDTSIFSARLTRQVHLDGFAPKNPPGLSIPTGSRICDGAGTFDLGGGVTEQDGFAVVGSPPVIPPLAINDVVQVAVDYDNEKVWFGINDIWVGSGTQDPATNQGGYWPTDFSSTAAADVTPSPHLGPFMWMFSDFSAGSPRINQDDILAWRFSQGFWDFTAPTGFTEWPDVISERNMPAANTFQWVATPAFGSPSPEGGMFLSTFDNRAVCGITPLGVAQLAYYNQSRLAGDGGKFYAESKSLHRNGLDVAFIDANAGSPINLIGLASNQTGSIGIDSDGEAKRDGSVLLGGAYDGSMWDFAPTDDGRSIPRIESGDTYMLAIDFDTNRFYMGVNGVWFLDENPSGSTGSPSGGLAITEIGSPGLQAYVLAGSGVGGTNLLNAGGVEFDYTIPTGYFPWGIGSPLPFGVGGSPIPPSGSPSGPTRVGFTGITVNLNDIATDITVVRTSGTQTIDGVKIFTDQLRGDVSGTSAAVPAFGFRDLDQVFLAGIYRSGTNELSFSTDGTQRFRIESTGVLRALDSNYETNVTGDDVIPNKKYVDDLATVGGIPTENTFVGVSSISGLNPNETYLVHGYGIIPHKRLVWSVDCILDSVILRRGTTTPGAGTVVASTPSQFMGNSAPGIPGPLDAWDGDFQSEASFICEMNGDTEINMEFNTTCSGPFGTECHRVERRSVSPAYFQRYSIHLTAVQITFGVGSPIVGSPLPISGTVELDDMPLIIISIIPAICPSSILPLSSLRINSNGRGETAQGSTAAFPTYIQFGNDWLVSGGPASEFEVKATEVSVPGVGYTTFGIVNTWLPLTSSRLWTIKKNFCGVGVGEWDLEMEIRQITNHSNTTGVKPVKLEVDMF